MKGTYVALFPVITAPEYDQLWLVPCAAVVGEDAGEFKYFYMMPDTPATIAQKGIGNWL